MAIIVYKQKTMNKKLRKKVQKMFLKKKKNEKNEIAGITNCEITKCGDPLYLGLDEPQNCTN